MKLDVSLTLPDELLRDLELAARESGCKTPDRYVLEVVEAEIASRRLPKVPASGGPAHGSVKD
jgi:hypothetical protein